MIEIQTFSFSQNTFEQNKAFFVFWWTKWDYLGTTLAPLFFAINFYPYLHSKILLYLFCSLQSRQFLRHNQNALVIAIAWKIIRDMLRELIFHRKSLLHTQCLLVDYTSVCSLASFYILRASFKSTVFSVLDLAFHIYLAYMKSSRGCCSAVK